MINEIAIFGIQWVLWLFLTLLFLVGLFSEGEENGTIVFGAFMIFLILYGLWGSKDILDTFKAIHVGYYLGVGIVFSVIKTFFWQIKRERKSKARQHVVRWILNWPMSLMFSLFGDLGTVFIRLTGGFYDSLEKAGKRFQK